MGNKRQRLARKNFKVVLGGDTPKQSAEPQAVAPSENGSKPAKKSKHLTGKKRKAAEGNKISDDGGKEHGGEQLEENGAPAQGTIFNSEAKTPGLNGTQKKTENPTVGKKSGSKHPLRVPGMKPGEGCFICKGTDHIAKLCPTKTSRDRKKICLLCRSIGHTLKNCPTSFESQESKFCYNCGENGHRLAECKKPLKDGGTGFAECFVCKKKGHLSKNCPTNPHGIYPKGGCCKLCQAVTHLAKDCPTKKQGGRVKLQISTAVATASESGGGKRTVFRSGDDLGDDFVSDDEAGDPILGALNYGSDDEPRQIRLETTGLLENTPKPESKKVGKALGKVTPNTAGSKKMQHTPKVVKFQRPK